MAKSNKVTAKSSQAKWPSTAVLDEIREKLSSDAVEGSRVLGADAPLADQIKQNLCSKIVEYRITKGITQKQLADKLGVDEPEMSRILHYKIERYSIDRLVGYLEILYPKMSFKLFAA